MRKASEAPRKSTTDTPNADHPQGIRTQRNIAKSTTCMQAPSVRQEEEAPRSAASGHTPKRVRHQKRLEKAQLTHLMPITHKNQLLHVYTRAQRNIAKSTTCTQAPSVRQVEEAPRSAGAGSKKIIYGIKQKLSTPGSKTNYLQDPTQIISPGGAKTL